MIGKGPGEVREESVLNRVVRRTDEGWEYEADQRHADIIVKAMHMSEAKAVTTAGEDAKKWREEEEREEEAVAAAADNGTLPRTPDATVMDASSPKQADPMVESKWNSSEHHRNRPQPQREGDGGWLCNPPVK